MKCGDLRLERLGGLDRAPEPPFRFVDVSRLEGENSEVLTRLAAELSTWREWALSLRPPPDTDAIESLSAEEIARLRSLGYIN